MHTSPRTGTPTFLVQTGHHEAKFRRLDDALRYASDREGAEILVCEAGGIMRDLSTFLRRRSREHRRRGREYQRLRARRIA